MAEFLQRFCSAVFDLVVNVTGTFLAAVLSHPDVETAVAKTMVRGMNEFVSRNQPELAQRAGQDFPKLVGSFFQGMMSPRRDISTEQSSQIPQPSAQPGSGATATATATATVPPPSTASTSTTTNSVFAKTPPRLDSPLDSAKHDVRVLEFPSFKREDPSPPLSSFEGLRMRLISKPSLEDAKQQ
jgi:hypothetical protein